MGLVNWFFSLCRTLSLQSITTTARPKCLYFNIGKSTQTSTHTCACAEIGEGCWSLNFQVREPRSKILFKREAQATRITLSVQTKKLWFDRKYQFSNRHSRTSKPVQLQYAFKVLMIHRILRFTLIIALCCVLHRCKSQDIHCQKLYQNFSIK